MEFTAPLVPQSVLSGELELGIETSRLKGTTGDLVDLRVVPGGSWHDWGRELREGRLRGVEWTGGVKTGRGSARR